MTSTPLSPLDPLTSVTSAIPTSGRAASVPGMYPEIDALTQWAWYDYVIYALIQGVVDPLRANLLLIVVLLPLVGAAVVAVLPSPTSDAVTPPRGKGLWDAAPEARRIQSVAMAFAMATVVATGMLYLAFDTTTAAFQFPVTAFVGAPERGWTLEGLEGPQGVHDAAGHAVLGVDGLSLPFVMLNAALLPICLMAGWHHVRPTQQKTYAVLFLSLGTLVAAVFTLLDLVLFYVAFEAVLIPMLLVIGTFGSRARKVKAAYQFFLYTLAGSILLLLGILVLTSLAGSSSYLAVRELALDPTLQKVLFLLFFASFAVKVPMVPFHLWLPEAHAEAPTGGSVILAGVLLKMGTYGFLRFSLPLFPVACVYFQPLVITMSLVAIVYASATTLRQTDWKKVIAYSSVAHMAYGTLGIFAFTAQGVEGAMLAMISHGIVSPGLFLLVGMAYERTKTRVLDYYGGVVQAMPVFTAFFFLMTLGTMAVPGTSGFPGEFLVLQGLYAEHRTAAIVAVLGTFLGTAYSLWLYNRVSYGHLKTTLPVLMDVSSREFAMLGTLAVGVVFLGVYPEPVLHVLHASSYGLVETLHDAVVRGPRLDLARLPTSALMALGAEAVRTGDRSALQALAAAPKIHAVVGRIVGMDPRGFGEPFLVDVRGTFATHEEAEAAAEAHRIAWQGRLDRVAAAHAEATGRPVDPLHWRASLPKSLTTLVIEDLQGEVAAGTNLGAMVPESHPWFGRGVDLSQGVPTAPARTWSGWFASLVGSGPASR